MTMASKQPPSAQLLTSISKTNSVVTDSLHRSIRQHTKNKEYDAETDGLDFLQVKNGLMISYLVDLTMLLRCRLNNATGTPKQSGDDGNSGSSEEEKEEEKAQQNQQEQECLERLLEMKAALEKIRPLEKRMRYQIDKLLALSTLGAGTFAAVGREQEEEEDQDKNSVRGSVEANIDEGDERTDELKSDPLSFKPDLQGMMKMFEEDGNEQTNENDSNAGSDVSDEEPSSKPKISLEKDDNPSGVYQPPRLQSVPFELTNEKQALKEQRLLEKQRDRQSRSELTQVIRSQFTDAPEEEDIRGGAMLGKQSEASRRLAAQDADIQEFEETQMIRLTMGKKEKQARRKMMREELSNLGAIASGLGSVVAGVDDAFGDGGGRGGKNGMGGGSFKTKGMRKRKVEMLDHEQQQGGSGGKRRSKKKGSSNPYQKSLYGGSGGGGKSRKKK